jgi:hypothetical protein
VCPPKLLISVGRERNNDGRNEAGRILSLSKLRMDMKNSSKNNPEFLFLCVGAKLFPLEV